MCLYVWNILHRFKIPRLWNDAHRINVHESPDFGADPGAKSHFIWLNLPSLKITFASHIKINGLLLMFVWLQIKYREVYDRMMNLPFFWIWCLCIFCFILLENYSKWKQQLAIRSYLRIPVIIVECQFQKITRILNAYLNYLYR